MGAVVAAPFLKQLKGQAEWTKKDNLTNNSRWPFLK